MLLLRQVHSQVSKKQKLITLKHIQLLAYFEDFIKDKKGSRNGSQIKHSIENIGTFVFGNKNNIHMFYGNVFSKARVNLHKVQGCLRKKKAWSNF